MCYIGVSVYNLIDFDDSLRYFYDNFFFTLWEEEAENIFFFQISFCWRCLTCGLNSCKPTHYLLHDGDYFNVINLYCDRAHFLSSFLFWNFFHVFHNLFFYFHRKILIGQGLFSLFIYLIILFLSIANCHIDIKPE